MKKITIIFISVFMMIGQNLKADTIYNTLGLTKTGYVYDINFPISQAFSINQNSKISNITVGVPSKITPGRQLSVILFDKNKNVLQTYSTPSSYYYNVDHYYTFNTNDYDLASGNYSFGVKVSHGPTGWIMTTGGMLGRIDSYCIPEPSTYIMGLIIAVVLFTTSWRIL